MPILVTGGGGFLGRHVCKQLLAQGHDVRSIARGDYPALRAMGVETVRGDLTLAPDVHEAARGCDAVIHSAAKVGMWGPREAFVQGNMHATANVIQACEDQGVRALVFTSSPSVTAHPGDTVNGPQDLPYPDTYEAFYPETKARAEQMVLKADRPGLRTTSLRPHLIWGPEDPHMIPRLIERARSGRLKIVGDGQNMVDLTYVDNAAAAHLQALDALLNHPDPAHAGRAYFISDDSPVKLWQWLNALFEEVGVEPVRGKISLKTARRLGAIAERTFRALGVERDPPMTRFVASQLATSHWYDMTPAREDFGYTPPVSPEQGRALLVEWIKRDLL